MGGVPTSAMRGNQAQNRAGAMSAISRHRAGRGIGRQQIHDGRLMRSLPRQ